MKYTCLVVLLLVTVLLIPLPASATCTAGIVATTPDSRFVDNNDGTVTDKVTGLTWKHCSEGQTWNGTTCAGSPGTYTWQQALAQGTANNGFTGKSDWRLPNVKEFRTIVERQCHDPAINENIFPATPLSPFWSGSPYLGNSNYAWNVNFNLGNDYHSSKSLNMYVRLVRGEQ